MKEITARSGNFTLLFLWEDLFYLRELVGRQQQCGALVTEIRHTDDGRKNECTYRLNKHPDISHVKNSLNQSFWSWIFCETAFNIFHYSMASHTIGGSSFPIDWTHIQGYSILVVLHYSLFFIQNLITRIIRKQIVYISMFVQCVIFVAPVFIC